MQDDSDLALASAGRQNKCRRHRLAGNRRQQGLCYRWTVLRRVRGYLHLPSLQWAMERSIHLRIERHLLRPNIRHTHSLRL
ncbi:MAG: hypothetical protein AUJ96_17245 [Armatimonadetes bacterium CG2_30_66_41]|nr:MAG: hypothetical protein AUJ96_17245 [Armatimonadetes bacterium CG2_30_66_41]